MNETEVAAQLAVQTTLLTTLSDNVGKLSAHVYVQNGRLLAVEKEQYAAQKVAELKDREDIQRSSNLKWMFGFGMAGAGTLSGIVFGIVGIISGAVK